MASENTTRIAFRLTEEEIAYAKTMGAKQGTNMAGAIRGILTRFVERGSRARVPETKLVSLRVDADLVAAAEKKALAENGASIRDIIRHELGIIYERP